MARDGCLMVKRAAHIKAAAPFAGGRRAFSQLPPRAQEAAISLYKLLAQKLTITRNSPWAMR